MMRKMFRSKGILEPEVMLAFPSGTAASTFPEWVANHVGLEQLLGISGFLCPDFYEVDGHLFWDRYVAEQFEQIDSPRTPFGDDPQTVERYFNTINLGEFFLSAADDAVRRENLLNAFGVVLLEFWRQALRVRFPDRNYQFEISSDLFNEEGLCFTFWRGGNE